ncbi:MAG: hypothetical protein LIP08_07835 [Bacteroides sp.]|nr:hypothetical protein [Bacteroides sp.]
MKQKKDLIRSVALVELLLGITILVGEIYDLTRLVTVAEAEQLSEGGVWFLTYKENTLPFIYFSLLCIATGSSFWYRGKWHWTFTYILLITSIACFMLFWVPHLIVIRIPVVPLILTIGIVASGNQMRKRGYTAAISITHKDRIRTILLGIFSALICWILVL